MVETRSSIRTGSSSAAARSTSHIPISPMQAQLLLCLAPDSVERITGVLERHKLTRVQLVDSSQIVDRLSTREFHCSVVDYDNPYSDGLELLKQLSEAGYSSPIIFLASHLPMHIVVRAMRRGAFAFVDKERYDIDLAGLVYEAIQRTGKGEVIDQIDTATQRQFATLSSRERSVLKMLVDGAHNRDVAAALNIGLRTVERDRRGLMEKMDAKSLPDLVRKAVIVYGQDFLYGLSGDDAEPDGTQLLTNGPEQARLDQAEPEISPPRSDFPN